MAVTAHFVDDHFKPWMIVLDFVEILGHHTGPRICDLFLEIVGSRTSAPLTGDGTDLVGFDLIEKIGGICLDNASNNSSFVKELTSRTQWSECFHIRCFAHVINLGAEAALKLIQPSISNIRKLVWAVKASPLRLQKLKEFCVSENVDVLNPIYDVSTRWNSTLDMLVRAKKLERALRLLLECSLAPFRDHAGALISVTQEDWARVADMIEFLQPFKECTLVVSGSSYATLSTVVPLYNNILDHLTTMVCENGDQESADTLVSKAATEAFDKVNGYYNLTSDVLTFATLLDPRLKHEYYSAFTTDSRHDDVEHADVLAVLSRFRKEHEEFGGETVVPPSDPSDSDETPVTPVPAAASSSSALARAFAWKHKLRIPIYDAFTQYFAEPIIESTRNPFEYWSENKTRFPTLAKMARKFLASPSSSVASERAFSAAGRVVTPSRSRLSSEKIRQLLYLKSWLAVGAI